MTYTSNQAKSVLIDQSEMKYPTKLIQSHLNYIRTNPKIPFITELFQESVHDIHLFNETELQSNIVSQNYILQ